MNSDVMVQSTFCNEYDSLLHQCETAQRNWSEWREEMNSFSSKDRLDKEVSDELLRLQAKFAKAYARLERHNRECEICQFAARMAEERGEYASAVGGGQQPWPA
jgi:predicted secreted protein